MKNILYQQSYMRRPYIDFVEKIQPDAFVTLATNKTCTSDVMKEMAGDFFGRMDRWYLGTRWLKLPREQRTNGIGFIEHVNSNIHAHILARFNKGNHWGRVMMAQKYWNTICNSGSVDVQQIDDIRRLASYCTKEMMSSSYDDISQMFFLPDFFSEKQKN